MDDLLRKAEDLGRLLADHPRFKDLMTARDAVRADEAARKLLTDYQAQVERIQELTLAQKPIEVSDKHRLAELEQEVASNEVLKKLTQAQADFSQLMSSVNRAIYDRIAPPDASAPEGD